VKVTLNGPAGAGKGTISRALSKETGIPHVDVGLVFRFAAYALHTGLCSTVADVKTLIVSRRMEHTWKDQKVSILFDKQDVTAFLHDPAIALAIAHLSTVRSNLISIADVLNTFLEEYEDVICDGKSAGTTILPLADFKFYVTADEEERASRRFTDLVQRGFQVVYEQVLSDVRERDLLDRQRDYDPLTIPEGALVLDTTHMAVEESVRRIRSIIGR